MNRQKSAPSRRKALPPRRVAARPTIEIMEDRTLLATHTVGGAVTLVDAINAANLDNSGAANIIDFASDVTSVAVTAALPTLVKQVEIAGRAGVVIDGGGGSFDGFRFGSTAASSKIHDLTIQNFDGAAILVQAGSVTVSDNTLGAATKPIGVGVLIDGSGGPVSGVAVSGNTIGFASAGVRITGAGATGNTVSANWIGVTSGGVAIGNPIGVEVVGTGANTIGGATAAAGNVIDVASTAGVRVAGASGVVVSHNTIGLAGTTPARKTNVGVLIDGATTAVSGVVVSANTIGRTNTAVTARAVGDDTVSQRVRITGNSIGTNAGGADLGNGVGVLIDGSTGDSASVVVGGTAAADANAIGHNATAGVRITGAGATGNTVAGNRIGTDGSGADQGNGYGVLIENGSGTNVVGGSTAGANVIANNGDAGVGILSGSNNRVLYNTYKATNGTSTPAGDVFLAPGVNGGIQPLHITTAFKDGSDARIQFSAALQNNDVVQVYTLTADGRTYVDQRTVSGTPKEIAIPASELASAARVLVTVTRTSGTSAFSNVVTLASLSVDTTQFHEDGKTSLWEAIDFANLGVVAAPRITFALAPGSIIDATGHPFTTIIKAVTIDGGASAPIIDGGGAAGNGLAFGAGSGGSLVTGLTFQNFLGAAVSVNTTASATVPLTKVSGATLKNNGVGVLLVGGGNTATGNTYVGNTIGIKVQGTGNTIQDETIGGSISAGVEINGANANNNMVYGNDIGWVTAGGAKTSGVGVRIVTGSGNKVGGLGVGEGNTISGNGQQGVLIQGGNANSVRGNTYQANGPDDADPAASAVVVLPQANQSIQPAKVDGLLLIGPSTISAQFVFKTYAGFATGNPFHIDIYQPDANGVLTRLDYAAGSSGDETLVVGTNTFDWELVGFRDDAAAVLMITDDKGNSTAFSVPAMPLPSYVVTTTRDYVPGPGVEPIYGSLRYALSVPDVNPIIFRIDDPATGGRWIINLLSPLDVGRQVVINGWNAVEGSTPETSPVPLVWLAGDATTREGLVFQDGSEDSTVDNLGFEGFSVAAIHVSVDGVSVVHGRFKGTPLDNDDPTAVAGVGVLVDGGTGATIGSPRPVQPPPPQPPVPAPPPNLFMNLLAAVKITGSASDVTVVGNDIGTDGVATYGLGDGVWIDGTARNHVRENLIGNAAAFDNGNDPPALGAGVRIDGAGATDNQVGGNNVGVVDTGNLNLKPGNDIGVYVGGGASGNHVGAYVYPVQGVSVYVDPNVIGNNDVGVQIDSSANNTVAGNYVGTDAGNRPLGNGAGILITGAGATGNDVGQPDATHQTNWNVIGFSASDGVRIEAGAGGNTLRNNYIGTTIPSVDYYGTTIPGAPIPNATGVRIIGASRNTIGPNAGVSGASSPLVAGANYISGNTDQGILVGAGAVSNVIAGNLIGSTTTAAGQSLFPGNRGAGVRIEGGDGTIIGDSTPGDASKPPAALTAGLANLILGNQVGVLIAGNDVASQGTSFGTIVRGNQIAQNVQHGVWITGDLNQDGRIASIVGNYVGTDWTGASSRINGVPSGNGLDGVLVTATGATSGALGFVAADVTGNLISANGLSGIEVTNDPNATVDGYAPVVVQGNVLGLNRGGDAMDASGAVMGNALDGIRLAQVFGVKVGGADPAKERNVISGNLGRGVEINARQAGSDPSGYNEIVNNYIGTTLDGAAIETLVNGRLVGTGNLSDGVFILGNADTEIHGNLIGGNRAAGIHAAMQSRENGTVPVFVGALNVHENFIGTSKPNDSGSGGGDLNNGSDGIFLDKLRAEGADATKIRIAANFIGANRANGINVLDSIAVTIVGNLVGDVRLITAPTGAEPSNGNSGNGISLTGSSKVTIGGTADADRNWISGNRGNGVVITGDGESQGNRFLGNYVGTDATGAVAVPNFNSGVLINGSSGNFVGADHAVGGALGGGNVISGNRLYGVVISGGGVGAGENVIAGNRIGTDVGGSRALANSADGVFILDNAGTKTTAGNLVLRNVISGNAGQGARIFGAAAAGNVVAGNYVGVGLDGATPIANRGAGVLVDNAGANTIGGASAWDRNVVSGNAQSGIQVSSTLQTRSETTILGNYVGTDAGGTRPVANGANGVFIFGASDVLAMGNVISGNAADGVQIFSPSSGALANRNRIYANRIGTDASAMNAVGNQGNGVTIINGFGNMVGLGDDPDFLIHGAPDAWRNVISGNANGVVVVVQADYVGKEGQFATAGPNHVSGNVIGLDGGGTANLGNRYAGVFLNNADGTVVGYADGFTDAGARSRVLGGTMAPAAGWASNVISANGLVDVQVTGTTTGARIRGNYLGTDVLGRTRDAQGVGLDLASSMAAILIDAQARNNWIGGAGSDETIHVEGTGNLVTQSSRASTAGAAIVGVLINSIDATGNRIQASLIGLDAQGGSGSNQVGVLLANARYATVGGFGDARNVIAGNAVAGVEINGPLATGNALYNNYVGVRGDGSTRPAPRDPSGAGGYDPSQESGVLINQASANYVGSLTPGLGNLISGNGNGVNVASPQAGQPAASANYVMGNTIGTDASGMNALPNFRSGVFITAAPNTQILGNLISANGIAGIQIFGGQTQRGGQGTAAGLGVTIAGNTIGLNRAGQIDFSPFDGRSRIHPDSDFPSVALPNDQITIQLGAQQHGVVVIGSSSNRIGLPGLGNVISGNTLTGVYISKLDDKLQSYATPAGNVVQSNDLRTNGIYGVFRYDAPNGNPTIANDFTGTPIPIGDFLTGQNLQASGANQAQSILLGTVPTTPNRPGRRPRPTTVQRPGASLAPRTTPTPVRPTSLQRLGMAQAARTRLR